MSMGKQRRNIVVRNLPNVVSFLGVLPIMILFGGHGYQYLVPLLIYNNVMDDLDGILASELNIRSNFGALLDNVCDAIAHTVLVMVVGMHFAQAEQNPYLGGALIASSMLATVAMIIRSVTRISPSSVTGTGSPTNELIRHIFFILILAESFGFEPMPYLIVTFVLHTASMLVPFTMPHLIRSLTKSSVAIGMVNVALFVAWFFPYVAPFIAASFVLPYLYSFASGQVRWLRRAVADGSRSSPEHGHV